MELPDLVPYAVPFFIVAMLAELAWGHRERTATYELRDATASLAMGVGNLVVGIFTGAFILGLHAALYEHRLLDLGYAWWVFALAFFLEDHAYYWFHRVAHERRWIWAAHVNHHSSQHYNLSTALRQPWTSVVSMTWLFWLPNTLLGVPPEITLFFSGVSLVYQFWIHTETIDRMGAFGWIFNTPSHHRVHHGINPEYLDKNYAGALIIWDRMFGTFEAESRQPVYGTVKPLGSFNPLWANLWYFGLLYKDSRDAQTSWERWKVWWSPPGYRPEGLEPYPVARQLTRSEQDKYDPEVPPGLSRYVFGHFLPMSVWIFCVLWYENTASTASLVVGVAMILWTAVAWGGLFERKSWAFAVEVGRVAAIGLFVTYLFVGDAGWVGLVLATWIGAAVSVAWIASYRSVLVEA